jgi:hypothetical protein
VYYLIYAAFCITNLYLPLSYDIGEAFIDFTQSDSTREISKKKDSIGGKHRSYLSRFKKES